MQQIGRAGRDQAPALSVLHFNNNDLGREHVSQEIKEYCHLKTCRREFLMKKFGWELASKPERCCDICNPSVHESQQPVLDTDLMASLLEYFQAENEDVDEPLKTGLSRELAKALSLSSEKYKVDTAVKDLHPDLDDLYIDNICLIINSHLNLTD